MRSPDGLDLLLLVIIVLLLVFPRPWFKRKEPEQPECFGDWPHYYPVDAAERDCQHCSFGMNCHDATPLPHWSRVPRPSRPTR